MEIKLRLYKSEIMKSAKDETFLSGRAELAADGANAERVYNLQAGDDATHEAKLLRSLRIGLDDLKSKLTNFIKNDGSSSGDNISDTLTDDYDYFDIVMDVSTRFNKGYVDSLASLASSYITEYTIGSWWTAVSPGLAQNYFNSAESIMASIRRCFIKIPPLTPVHKYPKAVATTVTADDFELGKKVELKYALTAQDDADGKYIDDIVVESSHPKYILVEGTLGDYTATLILDIPKDVTVTISMYSKHNPDECKTSIEVAGPTAAQ